MSAINTTPSTDAMTDRRTYSLRSLRSLRSGSVRAR